MLIKEVVQLTVMGMHKYNNNLGYTVNPLLTEIWPVKLQFF